MKLLLELDDITGQVKSLIDTRGRPVEAAKLPGVRLAYIGVETDLQKKECLEHQSSRSCKKNAVIFDRLSGLKRSFPPSPFQDTFKREIVTLLCLEIKREER